MLSAEGRLFLETGGGEGGDGLRVLVVRKGGSIVLSVFLLFLLLFPLSLLLLFPLFLLLPALVYVL